MDKKPASRFEENTSLSSALQYVGLTHQFVLCGKFVDILGNLKFLFGRGIPVDILVGHVISQTPIGGEI